VPANHAQGQESRTKEIIPDQEEEAKQSQDQGQDL